MSARTTSESCGVPLPNGRTAAATDLVGPSAASLASSREDELAWRTAEAVGRCLIRQWTEIFRCLSRGPIRVNDIAKELELDKATISHHLGGLRELGLVEFEKRGRDHLFRLSPHVRIVRAGQCVVIRLRLNDMCRMVISVRDLTSNLTPRAPIPGGATTGEEASKLHGHGQDWSDGTIKTRPLAGGASPAAPRRPGPRAK